MRSIRRPRAARRLKYVFIEVLIITLGLLPALAIDDLLEWRQHRRLVAEARQELRVEITENVVRADRLLREIGIERQRTAAGIEALKPFQNARDPQDASKLKPNLGGLGLTLTREMAWRTAQSTGALNYMPYEEAKAYNTIYSLQTLFYEYQREMSGDWAQLNGLGMKLDRKDNLLSAEGASEMALRLGALDFHLSVMESSVKALSKLLHAFLEGRPVTLDEKEG